MQPHCSIPTAHTSHMPINPRPIVWLQFEEDPDAFGMKLPQNPPSQAMQPSASAQSLGSAFSMASDGGLSELDSPRSSAAGSDWPETPVRKPHRRFRLVRQVSCPAPQPVWGALHRYAV